MKNRSLFLGFALIVLPFQLSVAQSVYLKHDDYEMSDSLLKSKGVKAIITHTAQTNKRGKSSSSVKYQYLNDQGESIFHLSIKDSLHFNKIYGFHHQMSHKKNTVFYNDKFYNSNFLKFTEISDSGQTKRIIYSNRRGRINDIYEYHYAAGKTLRLNRYKHKHKLSEYYLYQYQADGKLLQSALYDKHDKLLSVWDYSCSDEGKVSKYKDTFKLCTQTSYLADGSKIMTTNYFENYTKLPVQVIIHYNQHEQMTKYFKYKGVEKQLIEYRQIAYNQNKTLLSTYFLYANKQGQKQKSFNYIYNSNGSIANRTDSFMNKRSVDVNHYQYSYNSMGLIATCSISNQNRLYLWRRYEYRF
jgi:hypothetical protein